MGKVYHSYMLIWSNVISVKREYCCLSVIISHLCVFVVSFSPAICEISTVLDKIIAVIIYMIMIQVLLYFEFMDNIWFRTSRCFWFE